MNDSIFKSTNESVSSDWILFNPGPVNMDPSVRMALAGPDLCHREPEFMQLLDSIRNKLVKACMGGSEHTAVLLTGSGTSALEAAMISCLPPSSSVLVLENGVYGERLHCIAKAHELPTVHLKFEWGHPIELDQVRVALKENPSICVVAMAHHETSTGMLNDLSGIGSLAREAGVELLTDAISSLAAEPLNIVDEGVTWCIGSSNKCIEGAPGLSFVVAPKSAFRRISEQRPRAFYLDLGAHFVSQYDARTPLFTPAIQVLYSLDRALDILFEETLQGRRSRYASRAERLRDGLKKRGFRPLISDGEKSRVATVMHIPEGWTYEYLHDRCKERNFIIYSTHASLGNVVRLASMGQVSNEQIDAFLTVLDDIFESGPKGEF